MKYRKLPVVIEATQWFKNGDHPLDEAFITIPGSDSPGTTVKCEGALVRYYRLPNHNKGRMPLRCQHCMQIMQNHGWIDTLEGGHIVCPGDVIITGVKGEHYPCKPDIFSATYEPA